MVLSVHGRIRHAVAQRVGGGFWILSSSLAWENHRVGLSPRTSGDVEFVRRIVLMARQLRVAHQDNQHEADLSRLGARRRLGHSSRVVGTAAHVGGGSDLSDNHFECCRCFRKRELIGIECL